MLSYLLFKEGLISTEFCWISYCVYPQLPFISKGNSSKSAFSKFLPLCPLLMLSHNNGLGWPCTCNCFDQPPDGIDVPS